jgi:hypothetical protein
VPVLKVRSQFRSQLRFLQGANFFEPKQWNQKKELLLAAMFVGLMEPNEEAL